MFCKKCGHQISDVAKFCDNCGQKVDNSYELGSSIDKSSKHGNIQKCPNCGEPVDAFSLKCSACGYEFRNVKSSSAIANLSKDLNEIAENHEPQGTLDKLFNPGKIDKSTNRKIELIKNFSIPNAKEDILEFMIMATSNIDVDVLSAYSADMSLNDFYSKKALSKAWISKMQQAYKKASLTLKNDSNFNEIKSMYESKMREINKSKLKAILIPIIAITLCILLVLVLGVFSFIIDPSNKLEKLYSEIQVDINEGRYDEALIKVNDLRFDRGESSTKADLWDEKRENLIKIISEKKENEQK